MNILGMNVTSYLQLRTIYLHVLQSTSASARDVARLQVFGLQMVSDFVHIVLDITLILGSASDRRMIAVVLFRATVALVLVHRYTSLDFVER
jgi:hypothetical protein